MLMTFWRRGRVVCPECGGMHPPRRSCAGEVALDAMGPQAAARTPYPAPAVGAARPSGDGTLAIIGRTVGAAFATLVLLICVSVAGTLIAVLTDPNEQPGAVLAGIAVCVAVGVTLGMGLMWACARVYAKIVFSLLALVLFTGGVVMLVLAPALRQMNTPDLAEYRAFSALIWFGTVCTIAGLALGALCLRWALRPNALRRLARWARLGGSAYGVLLGISGVFAMLSLLTVGSGDNSGIDQSTVEQAIAVTAIAMWSLVPGLILTYHGISASMGEGSGEFRAPPVWWFALLFVGVLAVGGLNMAAVRPVAAPMPLLHAVAAAAPGIGLLALASRGGALRAAPLRGLSWRQVTLAAALSMTVATTIAVYFESLGGFGAVVLLLVHNGAFVDAASSSEFWDAFEYADVILTRDEQFVANLIVAAMFAPLFEEFAKGLCARFMMTPLTTRAQAFVLGAAAGAAFGFLEGLLYGLAGVEAGPGGWWAIMGVRAGSTSLHVFATGLVALAWWHWMHGRPRVGWALFALAVLEHGVWNGVAVVLESRIFGLETLSAHAIELLAYGFFAPMSVAGAVAVALIARHLRRAEAVLAAAGAPLAAMAPWLG